MNVNKAKRYVDEYKKLNDFYGKEKNKISNIELKKKSEKLWKKYYKNKPFSNENWWEVRRLTKNLVKGECEIGKCKDFVGVFKDHKDVGVCKKCKGCIQHCFYKCQSKFTIWKRDTKLKVSQWWNRQQNKFRKHQTPRKTFMSMCGGTKKNYHLQECDERLCNKTNKAFTTDKICIKHCNCLYPLIIFFKSFWEGVKGNWNIILGVVIIMGIILEHLKDII